MRYMQEHEDAYGREVLAFYHGEPVYEIVEREDGLFTCSDSPQTYFSPYEAWPEYEQQAIQLARGRVLDIGCGAGRVSLFLQEKGLSVLGVDTSPLALEVCRMRGVQNLKECSIDDLTSGLGSFDTIVMYGNNFGLLRSWNDARQILRQLHELTAPGARILAESNDPTQTRDPLHLAYQNSNRQKGKLPGQLCIRVRYRNYVTSWFEYLIVSKAEMEAILEGTGWQVSQYFDAGLETPQASMYVAILEKI